MLESCWCSVLLVQASVEGLVFLKPHSQLWSKESHCLATPLPGAQRLEFEGLPLPNNRAPSWAASPSRSALLGTAHLARERWFYTLGGSFNTKNWEVWGRNPHRWGPQGSHEDLISEWGLLTHSPSRWGLCQAVATVLSMVIAFLHPPLNKLGRKD